MIDRLKYCEYSSKQLTKLTYLKRFNFTYYVRKFYDSRYNDIPDELLDIIFEFAPINGFNVSKKYDASSLSLRSVETIEQYLIMIRRSEYVGRYVDHNHYKYLSSWNRTKLDIKKYIESQTYESPLDIFKLVATKYLRCPIRIRHLIKENIDFDNETLAYMDKHRGSLSRLQSMTYLVLVNNNDPCEYHNTCYRELPCSVIDIIFEFKPILGFNVSKKYDSLALTFQNIETVDQYLVMVRRDPYMYIHMSNLELSPYDTEIEQDRSYYESLNKLKYETVFDIINLVIKDDVLCPLRILHLIRNEYRPEKSIVRYGYYKEYKGTIGEYIEDKLDDINCHIKYYNEPIMDDNRWTFKN